MIRFCLIFFILLFSIQCHKSTKSRKMFSIEIVIDPVIQVGSDGQSGSFTEDFFFNYSERKYIVNQDTIRIYRLDSGGLLTQTYLDTLSNLEANNLYNYLRGIRLDTLNVEFICSIEHGMKSILNISGDSLPTVKIIDDFSFEPAVMNIIRNVDKLVKNNKDRMFYN